MLLISLPTCKVSFYVHPGKVYGFNIKSGPVIFNLVEENLCKMEIFLMQLEASLRHGAEFITNKYKITSTEINDVPIDTNLLKALPSLMEMLY